MIWARSDVKDGKRYAVHLCQSSDRKRFFRLADLEAQQTENANANIFFTTEEVPHDLLKRGDHIAISETVTLNSGQPYYVDGNGLWFTQAEWAQLGDKTIGFSNIRWSTGVAPKFPDR